MTLPAWSARTWFISFIASTILFKDAAQAPRAAAALRVTGPDLLRLKIMDGVVPEPEGGAHTDPLAAAQNLKAAILACFEELFPLAPDELVEQRYKRFRMFGTASEQPVLPRVEETNG